MHYDRKVAQKLGDTTALRAMQKPQPERAGTGPKSDVAAAQTVTKTETTPMAKPAETKPAETTPAETKPTETKQQPAEQPKPAPTVQEPAKPEPKKTAAKADTMEMNGIQVIVEKQEKKKTEAAKPTQKQEESKPATQPQPQMPEKVNGMNVFVLDPYSIPYKSAYYPYTSRPVYENNKTKFILARAGDTYQKLAVAMQLTEKNLRLYNDVYDGSEPIEDEVIYLEQKSTKSTVPYHTLQEGDTYRYIAQRYGIQLKILIKRNSGNINSYGVGDQICIGCN